MNLWTDFDNLNSQTGSPRYNRTRRLSERVVLSALRDWLLLEYVAPYSRSLGATRIYRRCYWIDGLGTETRSGQNGATALIEPVQLLSGTLAKESKPITLHGFVLDSGNNKRKEGRIPQENTSSQSEPLLAKEIIIPKEGGVLRASWPEISTPLLKEIDQSPAIFLLNPFGQSILTSDDLAPLFQRTIPTELCLLMPHKLAETRLLTYTQTTEGASAITTLLRTDRWKTLISKGEETTLAIDGYIELLMAAMKRHFLAVHPIPLLIQTGPAHVEVTPYTLIFATRRQDSLSCMNDAWCLYRRRLHEQSHRGVLGEDWFIQQQQERYADAFKQLTRRILQLGQNQRARRWPELRSQVLQTNFGQFSIEDYNKVIQKLLADGAVRCEWRHISATTEAQTEATVNTPPIPGNDDMLLWR